MIQRLTALLILIFTLTAATVAPADYCIVDDNPLAVRGQYTTIQAALDYGCSHIDVRKGAYPSFDVVNPNTTLEFQGAVIHNDFDVSVWIAAAAENTTLTGDLLIQGDSTGQLPTGDGFHGVGVYVNAPNVTIDGLRTSNLRSYSVYLPEPSAGYAAIRNFRFDNVCTDQYTNCCAATAIMFINGASDGTVQNGVVTGHSMFGGTWYGSSRITFSHNRALSNWGKIGENCDVTRRVFENYGLGQDGNSDNTFLYNYIDGGDGAFEIADVIRGSTVQGNTVRNVNSHFGVAGSGSNRGVDIYIIDNFFYCDGTDQIQQTNWFSGAGWIRGNVFDGCIHNNEGTIKIPSGAQGDGVFIVGNTFDGNGRVTRLSGSNVTFSDNLIINPQYHNAIYIDNGAHAIRIESNDFQSDGGLQAINSNGGRNLTIRDNYIEGHLWLLSGTSDSLVEGNEIHSTIWLGMSVPTRSIVRDNLIFNDGAPLHVDGAAIQGSTIYDNFMVTLDGTAAALPNCGTANTCRDNWTVAP
jgi:Right handed beta helix region